MRVLFHPILVPVSVVCLLLAANCVPQATYGLPYFPTPGSGYQGFCEGVLEYGWPKTARRDRFKDHGTIDARPYQREYSVSHAFGKRYIEVLKTKRSVSAFIGNAIFFVVAVLLSSITAYSISNRRFSLRSLFIVVALVGIMAASLSWSDPLATSQPWTLYE